MTYFVNYSNYKIDVQNSAFTFGIIFFIVILCIVISKGKSQKKFLDIKTTQSLKGIAIIFLLFGHMASKCLNEKMFFRFGGYWAVIIFLFISGFGLTQKYGFNKIGKQFWIKRIKKLYIPLWISLMLFIFLDYFLINLHHPYYEIVFNFLGGHFSGALVRVNSVAWFVEYILLLYFIFFCVSYLSLSKILKVFLLVLLVIILSIIIRYTPIYRFHSIWLQYTLAFPVGVVFGYYYSHNRNIEWSQKSFYLVTIILLISLGTFFWWNSLIPNITIIKIFHPLFLIIALIMLLILYCKISFHSKVLIFLGDYSYEIYLLHIPFMVKYDFFLFRKPLFVYFFVYCFFIIGLSVFMSRIIYGINGYVSINLSKAT